MAHVSVKDTLEFSFSFLFRNAARIAARIALPALGGWFTFYIAFFLYLTELERYLGNPSDRVASLVLGLATAGLLVTLFMHAIIVSAIASLALGLEAPGWKYFSIGRRAWRLYAADLRCVLVFAAFIAAVRLGEAAIGRLGVMPGQVWIADLVMGVGLYWLFVRFGFLVAPIAVARRDGEILRRGWRLSSGHFWSIKAITAVLALPGFAIELAGEFLLRLLGTFPELGATGSMASLVALYREILPAVLIAIGVGYLVAVTLLTLARVSVYRQLMDQPET
ncbi:MAG TPA: hypothetical protein VGC27_01365 [Rhizomicrobium sp.]